MTRPADWNPSEVIIKGTTSEINPTAILAKAKIKPCALAR